MRGARLPMQPENGCRPCVCTRTLALQAGGKVYYVDAEHFENKALLARLVPQVAAAAEAAAAAAAEAAAASQQRQQQLQGEDSETEDEEGGQQQEQQQPLRQVQR